MSPLRLAYLALAVWGAIHPMAWFIRFLSAPGTGLSDLPAAWTANAAATGLFWDMAIAATAFTLWVCAETLVRRNWIALLALPATLGIGLGCGLPLYLFLRAAPIR